MDQRGGHHIAGELTQSLRRNLSRWIVTNLKADRIERARKVRESLMGNIQVGDIQEAWRSMQGWCKEAGAQQAKKCHNLMEKHT